MQTPLKNHTTPDTAYVVDDYPYGFRLRCKIRYWLEYVPGKGFRFWSQTSNPKRGDVWNKPKSSTYCRFGGCMFRDESNGHISWNGLSEYDNVKTCADFLENYSDTMPEHAREYLRKWVSMKLSYEQAKLDGCVKSTITTTNYGVITEAGFGTPIEPPTKETRVLESDYTAEQLQEIGASLNTEATFKGQLAKLSQ
jgi:hypothetical protein